MLILLSASGCLAIASAALPVAIPIPIPILAGIQVSKEDKRYDVACIWDEEGKKLGEYKKIHLWDTENDFFDRGEELVTVPFKGWNIGLLICADYGFPEVSTPLAQKKDADIIIYPSAWGVGWEDLFTTCSKMRAAENQVYTVALNRASGDVQYCGNTTVSNPDGSTLVRLATTDEAYARVALEKEKLEEARKGIPWRNMKRYFAINAASLFIFLFYRFCFLSPFMLKASIHPGSS